MSGVAAMSAATFTWSGSPLKPLPLSLLLLAAGACGGGHVNTRVVYAEPALRVYEVPVDHAVLVTRGVLERRGYVVYRVQGHRGSRIVWGRRGSDEIVRIFLTPDGRRVAVRGVVEGRARGRRGWVRRGPRADELVGDIDIRLRSH